jgi:hypothetical protein
MSDQSARTELRQQIQELGVETVTAEYSGSGDAGQIETPEFKPVEVPHDVVRAVENYFYELLQELYGGWEDNEGAFGHFTWNVKDDTINLVHNVPTGSFETEEQTL